VQAKKQSSVAKKSVLEAKTKRMTTQNMATISRKKTLQNSKEPKSNNSKKDESIQEDDSKDSEADFVGEETKEETEEEAIGSL
jgi:hypothetical protein